VGASLARSRPAPWDVPRRRGDWTSSPALRGVDRPLLVGRLIVLFLHLNRATSRAPLHESGPVMGAGPARTLAKIYRERPAQVRRRQCSSDSVMVMLM